jgi:hypothetical protein
VILCPDSIRPPDYIRTIYRERKGSNSDKSMESQLQFIKALHHTYITKIPRRHREEHAKKETK